MKRIWPTNLNTPTPSDYQNPDVIVDVRKLRTWLDQLPLMRLNTTLQSLKTAIDQLNKSGVAHKNRMRLLNEYRATLLKIYPTSEPEVIKRLPVKPEDRITTREEMGSFCRLLADGYKIVLKEAYETGEDPGSPVFLHALYHCIEALILELVNHFRCYLAVRPGLYGEIYLLYKIAWQGGVHRQVLPHNPVTPGEHSIEDIFMQGLLLASADPFRLPQSTALELFYLFKSYTRLAHLSIQENTEVDANKFVINLNRDLPPTLAARIERDTPGTSLLVLNKEALEKKILADLTQLQAQEKHTLSNDSIDKLRLLRILQPVAEEKRTRKTERKKVERHVKAISGIEYVHRFFALGPEQLKILLQTDADEFDGVCLETWTIQNESLTGYMLSRKGSIRQEIRVGDVLAIHNPEEDSLNHPGKIAIIRWMQQDAAALTQIGVELIPGKIIPAACSISGEENEPESHYRGIFVSAVSALNQPATLLFEKRLYRRGRVLQITVGQQPLTIEANFLREDSFCFDRFDFSSIEN